MNDLEPRSCDTKADLVQELAVTNPALLSPVPRPKQVSLYETVQGVGGNGMWYKGQTGHGNKGADLKTWTAEWHKQRTEIYGADALIKAEAKSKAREVAAAKVRPKWSAIACASLRGGD